MINEIGLYKILAPVFDRFKSGIRIVRLRAHSGSAQIVDFIFPVTERDSNSCCAL